MTFGIIGSDKDGKVWGCIDALEDFIKSEKYERLNPFQKQIEKIKAEKDELNENFRVKEQKIEKELNALREDFHSKNRGFNEKVIALTKKENEESIKDFNDICKKI